jgi:hypothetical protein
VDVSGLGAGASDGSVIAWCAQEGFVFVTKDWRTSSEPLIAGQLKTLGVSAVWVRHEKKHNLASIDLLYVAARDLRKLIPSFEKSAGPLYYECRLGVSARLITVPTPRLHRRPRQPRRRGR